MAKYIRLDRIESAITRLRAFPPAVVAFLAMKKAGVNSTHPVEYGSPQENLLLKDYFVAPGAPPNKVFFVPFSQDGWVDPKYSGNTLQRARTSKNAAGHVFANGLAHPNKKTFSFLPDVLDHLTGSFPKGDNGQTRRLSVYDVLAWLRRNDEQPDDMTLYRLVDQFKTEFKLTTDEFNRIFDTPTDESAETFFAPAPYAEEDFIRVLKGRQTGVRLRQPEDEFIVHLEKYVADQGRFILPVGFVRSFYQALKAQNFVILIGKPGTGKTQFVAAFIKAFMDFFQSNDIYEVFVGVSSEQSESDIIGYENLEGKHVTTEVVEKLLESEAAREKRGVFFLVLDEFNLAHPDRYLAKLLPAIETDQQVSLPARKFAYLSADTYLVATANSYLEESTRLPLSGPMLRRAHVIEMPNMLTSLVSSEEPDAAKDLEFRNVLVTLARQTVDRLTDRAGLRGESFLDAHRKDALEKFADDPQGFDVEHLTVLRQVCTIFAEDPLSALTFGVVQDAMEYIIMSGVSDESLDRAIVQKILPQVRGKIGYVESVRDLLESKNVEAYRQSRDYADRLVRQADPVTGEIQPLI